MRNDAKIFHHANVPPILWRAVVVGRTGARRNHNSVFDWPTHLFAQTPSCRASKLPSYHQMISFRMRFTLGDPGSAATVRNASSRVVLPLSPNLGYSWTSERTSDISVLFSPRRAIEFLLSNLSRAMSTLYGTRCASILTSRPMSQLCTRLLVQNRLLDHALLKRIARILATPCSVVDPTYLVLILKRRGITSRTLCAQKNVEHV